MKRGLDQYRYNRVAAVYDLLESPMELLSYSRWREEVFKWIPEKGKILEVGVGTGKNLSYYEDQTIVGMDISENMLHRAKSKTQKLPAWIHLAQMDVETLGFPDEMFDAAVSTFVFCSVENPLEGLKEIKRVLKPNGVAVFLEHMRSENEFLGLIMDLLNPITANAFSPNINRYTSENIKKAGFKIHKEKHLLSSIFRIIVTTL